MNIKTKDFLKITASCFMVMCVWCLNCETANAARTAVRGTPAVATRRSSTTAQTTPKTTTPEPVETVEKIEYEPEPEYEPETIVNKASQFGSFVSENGGDDSDIAADNLAAEIRRQRAAADARDNAAYVQSNQTAGLRGGKNVCDIGLRECMQKDCGNDFTKCALDGDTLFGDKLNRCRRNTTCTGEEFKLFTTEIKADRDMNVRLASYNAVIECGNSYNGCIQNICGATFEKCLGKAAADRAIQQCAKIAKQCTEQDSGLAARVGSVIGTLRENAERDVKTDETRMYKLRDLMKSQCTKLGAMFDERSFDCVYTVNFFVGENQTHPTASRKVYAGDTFTCLQEWFGINATTFKENAYRETRAQSGASSAMLGSGLGTAVGLVTSGAMSRALETQQAKKAAKEDCEKMPGKKWKGGDCVDDKENASESGNEEGEESEETRKERKEKCATQTTATGEACKWRPLKNKGKGLCDCDQGSDNANAESAQAIIDDIPNIAIGHVLTFNKKKLNDPDVTAALKQWRDACRTLEPNNSYIKATDAENSAGKMRCIVTKCQGDQPTINDSTACVPDIEDEDETVTAADMQRKVDAINKSAMSMHIGASISLTQDEAEHGAVQTAVKNWIKACGEYKSDYYYVKSAKAEQTGNHTLTCVIKECTDPRMVKESKACKMSDEDVSAYMASKYSAKMSSQKPTSIEQEPAMAYPDKAKISQQILNSARKIQIGVSFSFDAKYEKVVENDISAWGSACKNVQNDRSTHIITTKMNKSRSGNNLTLTCVVSSCDDNYSPTTTGCVKNKQQAKGKYTPEI